MQALRYEQCACAEGDGEVERARDTLCDVRGGYHTLLSVIVFDLLDSISQPSTINQSKVLVSCASAISSWFRSLSLNVTGKEFSRHGKSLDRH